MAFMPRDPGQTIPGWPEFPPSRPQPQQPLGILEFGFGVLAQVLGGGLDRNQFPDRYAGLPPSLGLFPEFLLPPPFPGYPGLLGKQRLGEPRRLGLLGFTDENAGPAASSSAADVRDAEASAPGPDDAVRERLSNQIHDPLGGVPEYKREHFGENPEQWYDFIQATGNLPHVSANENLAYREIFAAEGGLTQDANSTAVAGITEETLKRARRLSWSVRGLASETVPSDLLPKQRAQIYRAHVNDVLRHGLGHETLENIDRPGVAAFVADTAFRGGQPDVGMIQEAINEVRETRRKKGTEVDDIVVDTRFGPETLVALNDATRTPEERRIFATKLKSLRDLKYKEEQWRTAHFYELATGQR